MSADYVRIKPGALHRRRAPLDHRLMVRMPRVAASLRKAVFRLPPRSRIRQALVSRIVRLAFSALERGEFAVPMQLLYSPEVEYHGGELGRAAGLDSQVHGRAELERWLATWHEGFAWIEYDIPELLDLGDAFVFTLHQIGEGRASGVRAEITTYTATRIADTQVVWQAWYSDPDEALRAAGADPRVKLVTAAS